MNLEFYEEEKLKKEIKSIIGEYLDLSIFKIFFFGSRVRGDNFSRADIDIGIEGLKEVPAVIKFQIKEKINNLPTLYKFDIVDFKEVSKDFKKEALKNIEYVK